MKQFKGLLIFCLLLSVVMPIFSVRAQADSPGEPLWLAADASNKPGSAPQTQVLSVDEHTLDITITFSGVWAEIQTGDGQFYTRLWHEEYSSYREPGQPALPGKTFNILVPQGAEVKVAQQSYTSHSVHLTKATLPARVIPAQRQASKSEPPPAWTAPDPARYASRSPYPQRWYDAKDTFQMRDDTILPLWINPVRYQPAIGELELLERIELRLTWPEMPAESLKSAVKHDSPSFDRLVSQIVINPPPQEALDHTTKSGEGYLIITPDEFESALTDFVSMKRSQEYSVEVTLLSEIPGFDGVANGEVNDILAIQNFIKSIVPPPVYLLLVGDTNLLPAPAGDITGLKTDLYYGTLGDENDYVPDIHIGRLPARSVSDVVNMVNKLVAYSNGGYQDWHAAAAFISTCDTKKYDEDTWNYQIAEGSHNYVIDHHTAPLEFPGDFPEDENPLGGDQLYCVTNEAKESDIISRLDTGRGLITYSGHGSEIAWADGGITIINSDVAALNSNDVYSFVTSFACLTNNFGSPTYPVGFGETWMIQPNKGAIGFLGSAGNTQWGQDDVLEKGFFDSIFENPFNPNKLREALSYGLIKVEENYPGTALYQAQYYWETYNLLGDPSQQLWLVPEYHYEASTAILEKDGLINGTVRYPIQITNLGTTDTYTAVFSGNSWPVSIDELIELSYQSTGTLWVNVFIPSGTEVDTYDVVEVTVSSTGDPTQTTLLNFTTTAIYTYTSHLPVIFK